MTTDRFPNPLGRDDVFIVRTLDGSNTLFSRRHNATYHSIKGAVSESRHVFIQNGLKKIDAPLIKVLEIGFGTGLNAFLSFLFSRSGKHISYTGIETHSLSPEILNQLAYADYLHASQWEFIFQKMHTETCFEYEIFQFQKRETLPDITNTYDCIFWDAFSPDVDPRLWEVDFIKKLYNMTAPGGYVVTYCAKGDIRRKLTDTGYKVERLAGAPGKLHMLRGRKIVNH